ncbi:MAG: YhdP family protein [Legionella sp.]|nr:YhdP family protein [Legionella sp.]
MTLIRYGSLTKFLKRCWFFLAVLIIIAAVLSSLFRALTPWAKQYKTQVEHHLSTLLGEPVSIDTMETGWYWFEPVIKLKHVAVSNGENNVIQLKKMLVGINLFSSLWHWQIQPGVLYIDSLNLSLRQTNNHWQVEGLVGNPQMQLDSSSYQTILAWILAQQKIIIKNVSTKIYLQDGSQIPVTKLNLGVVQKRGLYYISGDALLGVTPTSFHWLAEMALDPYALKKSRGHLFVSADKLQLAAWQKFFPKSQFKINDGEVNTQLWLDWRDGKVQSAQNRIGIHHFAFEELTTKQSYLLPYINANLAWKPSKTGWELTADHLMFKLDHTKWPENTLMIRYDAVTQTWFVYVKHLIVESLMSISSTWPKDYQPFVAALPHGELIDTQFNAKDLKLEYLLTRFTRLGWQSLDDVQSAKISTALGSIPGVENLSGVLHWQPSEGSLELDGVKTIIKPRDKPAVTFKALNGAFKWKELSHGLRVSMERLVINHPQLLISASGAVDDITRDSLGQLNLSAQVSANNAQRWLTYLPSQHLRPKLDEWLKQNIKHIDNLVAEVDVNGEASDFPFDKGPGQFQIKGYARGVDLYFVKNWPLTIDMEAYFQVNKRLFEVDVVHANLLGTIVQNGNLRIDDIGLNRETLLLHTKIDADTQKALTYILATPLSKKLSTLKMLRTKGNFNLDLRLEAPLYPENDEVLALGDIAFNNNQVTVNHTFGNVQLNALNGSLQFDHDGILDSSLKATIMDYPVTIYMQSVRNPQPYVEVSIKGKTTIDVLRDKFDLPAFSLMQGTLWIESLLTITDEPSDLDHIRIQSSLEGVAINLPEPFGKSISIKAPLTVDVDFNPTKALRVRINYNDRVSSDLWFSGPKGKFYLEKGEIRLGSGQALWQKQQGLQVVGVLPLFDLQQWKTALSKLPTVVSDKNLLSAIHFVDVILKKTIVGNQQFDDVHLKVSKLPQNEWAINIRQQDIMARLNYQLTSNRLKGTFSRLHVKKFSDEESRKTTPLSLNAGDFPNLDLQINDLLFGELDLGDVKIQTTALKNAWRLDSCKITAPFYQFTAKGQWTEGKTNSTNLQANLEINDLAKALASWKISPAVEAHRGSIQFQGTWPGAFHDFSLAKVSGQLAISFKNGRITNLSPETEEKLGLGKLLSILSLQTIPRRLKLDFSDLSQDGYSFDEFKGHFKVANGLMTTHDSFINGPIAYASMNGDLDIARQLYNLDLKVSPHVTASLPVVATIAGGPVAGIATWVVSKIINQGMQKISGYTYKISGPWKQPVVQQVSIIKKKKV